MFFFILLVNVNFYVIGYIRLYSLLVLLMSNGTFKSMAKNDLKVSDSQANAKLAQSGRCEE